MFRVKKTLETREQIHHFGIHDIPMRIYFERRRNVRISFGQQKVILRIPYGLNSKAVDKHLAWAGQWIDDRLDENPVLLSRFIIKEYKSGDKIMINGDHYELQIKREDRKSLVAQLKGRTVLLKLPKDEPIAELDQYIKQVLSRLFASVYQEEVSRRIDYFNDRYFKEDIQSVRIKYNKSNWGSCSAKRNINISSRLLFAPKEIQDYVFVHELTHLKELNHSHRFWQIVASIIPDYKAKEKWLKVNGHLCDF